MVRFFWSMEHSPPPFLTAPDDGPSSGGEFLRRLVPQPPLPQDGIHNPPAGLTVSIGIDRLGHGAIGARSVSRRAAWP